MLERVIDPLFALDRDGHFTHANSRAARLFGRRPGDLIGRQLWTEFPESVGRPFREACERALAEQRRVLLEECRASDDRWLESTIDPAPDGLSICIRDITDRKRAEAEAQLAQQRFVDIVDFLPDATFVIDRNQRVIAWNRACETLTGVKKEALLGRGDHAYAEPFFGERRPILIDLLDRPIPEVEALYKYVRREGDTLFAESFIARLRGGRGAHLWGEAKPLFDEEGRRWGAIEVIRDVTEQKRMEQALRENEVKYRTLFETAADAIFLMRGDRFIDCNARTLDLFGCSREQILGASPYQFSPALQPDGRPSKDRALEKIRQAQTSGPQTFEWLHCRADGSPFDAEVSLNLLQVGGEGLVQAIVRDVTARVRAETARQESERKYRELVEHANSIILRWTHEGRITFLNEFGQRFFGYAAEEIVGRHVMGTIVPANDSDGRDLRRLMDEICADPAAFEQNVNENVRRNGERVWIAWTNRIARDAQGRVAEIFSVGTDITERRRAEAAIRELNAGLERRVAERTAELAVARDRAESADRIKSAFLATMSHELRTPLNSIIGFSGILLQGLAGPLNAEQAKQLGMVCRSAEHLLALINDVLDISKIEAAQLQVARDRFDLGAVVSRAVGVARPLAERKGLTVEAAVDPAAGSITSDPRRVEQVLLNLLSNGIKFTERGGVRLAVRSEPGRVVFEVCDTGLGIREADLDRLFKPFTQIDTGIARRHEGTGLGLSICKRLVELLGGSIWVRSEWGRGSTFGFDLPAGPEDAG